MSVTDSTVRVAVVQTKPRKGDYPANLAEAAKAFGQIATGAGADLVVLPEAALTGYFLEGAVYDLALPAKQFARDLAATWREASGGTAVDIAAGFYENDGGTYYNSALYLHLDASGEAIVHVHRKMFLPTYGVFDEERFLSRGRKLHAFDTQFGRIAMLICEDVWHSIVPTIAAIKGARILIVPSAAPGRGVDREDGELTSITRWRQILKNIAAEHGVAVIYAGLTGFEGGKGMSGSSMLIDAFGKTLVEAPATQSCILEGRIDLREIDMARASLPLLGDLQAALPDLLLDDELPLPRRGADASDR